MDSNPPGDARRFAPAIQRNREPILRVLREELPASGLVLEVASGTGEHALAFAAALPGLQWQPSEPSVDGLASIAAWRAAQGTANLLAPLALDAASWPWPIARGDALVCINLLHISPWAATVGLMRGAGHLLALGAPLIVYGPFRRADRPLEPSNAAFDADLKMRDAAWGLREVSRVEQCAAEAGLRLKRVVEMPANNLTLVFRRT